MRFSARALAQFLAVPLVVVAFVAGCGETVIDDAKTEAAIEQNLQRSTGRKVSSVDCPSDVEVEAGTRFDCTVTLSGGKEETATLKILNQDADVEVAGLKANK